jgi:Tfp pilus assembly protein PilO
MNTIREKKQIIIIIAAVLMVGGFVLFSYMPLQKKKQLVSGQKNAQSLVIAKGRADEAQVAMVEKQLSSLQAELEDYQTSIPSQNKFGLFLQQIADLLNQNSLKEQQITPGQEMQQDELTCIPVRIQCKGRISEIFEFIRQLQNLGRYIRVEPTKFENDSQYSGIVNMDLGMVIYYRTNFARG